MCRAEGVVLAFGALRKARQAAHLAQGRHALAAAGEDLVRIGLVAHVPHDAVARRVEHLVQRHRQFHGAEVGRQVPAGLRDALQHERPQFIGQRLEFRAREPTQIGRIIHGVQQGVWVR
ncbi:hypothetical protein SDC9_180137 [bioreactor metagenome]|uniref:Uncharacterized protein n=1 Tax=bioreactor metagenome TaxID=1076179 RepID=A0A645H0V2_9ZZZZ